MFVIIVMWGKSLPLSLGLSLLIREMARMLRDTFGVQSDFLIQSPP